MSSATLAALQQQFQSAVLADNGLPGLFSHEDQQPDLAHAASATDAESGGHFAIYLNAYSARLAEALRANFPILHQVLGDDGFDDMARAYIQRHPSPYRSIRWFGGGLANFIREDEDQPAPLADLAEMEWALRDAFDAADQTPLAAEALGSIAPEHWPTLRLSLHPAVHLVNLQWHIEPIWHTLSRDPEAETDAPDQGEHTLLVWRTAYETRWRTLEPAETAGLWALHGGADFTGLCSAIAQTAGEQDALMQAVQLLQRWVAEGVIGSVG